MLDYKIHESSGKTFYCVDDIIVTPFWSEEFCKEIIEFSKLYQQHFKKNIEFTSYSTKKLGWEDLDLGALCPEFFKNYTNHFNNDITPMLHETYSPTFGNVSGWFSPYVIRYTEIGQRSDLHHDVSHITFNIKLNDDYTGCELYFPRQNFGCKDIPIGHAIIWPSTVTHPHGSTELESGEKYSFVSWTWPPAWDRSGISGEKL